MKIVYLYSMYIHKTFPGFKIFFGSRADFINFIVSNAAPTSALKCIFLLTLYRKNADSRFVKKPLKHLVCQAQHHVRQYRFHPIQEPLLLFPMRVFSILGTARHCKVKLKPFLRILPYRIFLIGHKCGHFS